MTAWECTWMSVAVLLPLRLPAQNGACAPTPEAAAARSLLPVGPSGAPEVRTGYRVQDIQVDALTRHVWVRVRRCDNTTAPAILVPVQASLGTAVASLPSGSLFAAEAPRSGIPGAPPTPALRVLVVQPGDAVRVVMNGPTVRMQVEGKALQSAALGERIEVDLRRIQDEPAHRIVGILRANHMVEVQP